MVFLSVLVIYTKHNRHFLSGHHQTWMQCLPDQQVLVTFRETSTESLDTVELHRLLRDFHQRETVSEKADFYLVVSGQTYVWIPRLLDRLKAYSGDRHLYLGDGSSNVSSLHPVHCGVVAPYHTLEGGFVISRWTLEHWVEDVERLYGKPTIDRGFRYWCCYSRKDVRGLWCPEFFDWDQMVTMWLTDPPMMTLFHQYVSGIENPPSQVDVDPRWTLVTGLFNLHKYDSTHPSGLNQTSSYLQWINFVLSLRVRLVVYCEPEMVEIIQQQRDNRGLGTVTKVIGTELTEWEFYGSQRQIQQNRRRCQTLGGRHTPIYFIMTATKFLLVKDAIEKDYFGDGSGGSSSEKSFYGWIDAGLAKHVTPDPELVYDALSVYREKFSCCCIDSLNPTVVLDAEKHYRDLRCCMAAGFWTAERRNMLEVCKMTINEFYLAVRVGHGYTEEQFLSRMYYCHPDKFELWYGDYTIILHNYRRIKLRASHVLHFPLHQARTYKSWVHAKEIALRIYGSLEDGLCYLSDYDRLVLADNLLLIGFYHDANLLAMSKKVYHHTLGEQLELPEHLRNYLQHGVRNFDCLNWSQSGVNGSFIVLDLEDVPDPSDPWIQEQIQQGSHVFIRAPTHLSLYAFRWMNPTIRPRKYPIDLPEDRVIMRLSKIPSSTEIVEPSE